MAHKVSFLCVKTPDMMDLAGFENNKVYHGRYFNGVYEISLNYYGGSPSQMIDKRLFDLYFQEVNPHLQKAVA